MNLNLEILQNMQHLYCLKNGITLLVKKKEREKQRYFCLRPKRDAKQIM